MILGEPPRTQGDLHFNLLGIPVRIHPWFWGMGLVLGLNLKEPVLVMLWVVAMFICILIHELGHVAVIRSFGYHPWIVLHGFGGLAVYNPGQPFARRPGPLGQLLISAAGPAAGFLLAVLMVLGFTALGYGGQIHYYDPLGVRVQFVPVLWLPEYPLLQAFIFLVFQITVLWGVINLLPVYPLDGGQIVQQFLLLIGSPDAIRQSLVLSIVTAAGVAALALMRWNDTWMAFFFGYLAYSSYTTLQAYNYRGPQF